MTEPEAPPQVPDWIETGLDTRGFVYVKVILPSQTVVFSLSKANSARLRADLLQVETAFEPPTPTKQ